MACVCKKGKSFSGALKRFGAFSFNGLFSLGTNHHAMRYNVEKVKIASRKIAVINSNINIHES